MPVPRFLQDGIFLRPELLYLKFTEIELYDIAVLDRLSRIFPIENFCLSVFSWFSEK